MPTERSIRQVEELKKTFESSQLVISVQYTGLKMAQLSALRGALRPANTRFQVVKNTIAGIAADQAGRAVIREVMGGQVGIVTSSGDPVSAAKLFTTYVSSNRLEVKIIGGVLGSQVLTPAAVDSLAKLPSKEVLVARLLGQMNAPITSFVTVLNGPVRGLAVALQRIAEQKGKEAPAAAPAG